MWTKMLEWSVIWLSCNFCVASAGQASQWDDYMYSPSTRTTPPRSIRNITGDAAAHHANDGTYLLSMLPDSRITLDFGVEVGGYVSFNINTSSTKPISLAFTESSDFIRPLSDDTGATYTENWDGALNVTLPAGTKFYRTSGRWFRGGFRYLTINAHTPVEVWNVTCEIGFAPNMRELRNYTGHFHISSPSVEYEILNRVWYAGVYTVQTNIAPQNTGRYLPQVRPGWAYNATLGIGPGPFLLDAAKRDRAVWPGDIGISGPTASLAFGAPGLESWRNSLETLFYYQNASTGELPFAGPDTVSFQSGSQSDTYHTWGLISMYDYALYSGDEAWLRLYWRNITRATDFIVERLSPENGLQNQTQPNDWGRQGGGGYNSALNALDYHALVAISSLPPAFATQATRWMIAAQKLKQSYNNLLYSSQSGMYNDNTTTTLNPQDGNSLALIYGLANSSAQAARVSDGLTKNWNSIGPVAPELPDTISPFVSGLEVLAHYRSNNARTGLTLLKRLWTYLLEAPQFTRSTFAEGITANGSLYYRSTDGYDYDAAYTSLSHGWSTAPVSILMHEVLGLQITGLGGSKWTICPQVDGFPSGTMIEGGFETRMGNFEALVIVRNDSVLVARISTPLDTQGIVGDGWQLARFNGKAGSTTKDMLDGGQIEIVLYRGPRRP